MDGRGPNWASGAFDGDREGEGGGKKAFQLFRIRGSRIGESSWCETGQLCICAILLAITQQGNNQIKKAICNLKP